MLRSVVNNPSSALRRGSAGLIVLTVLLAALVLAPAGASASSGGPGWHGVAVVPGGAVNAVTFSDAAHGWAVNANVFVTADGGATWTAQTSGTWTLQDVTSTTTKAGVQGWAVGADAAGQRAVIAVSTANGAWVERASFAGMSLNAVDFGDGASGYAVGTNGAIVATGDGGGKWAALSSRGAWDLRDVVVTATPAVFLSSVTAPGGVFAVGRDPKTQKGVIVAPTAAGGWGERASWPGTSLNAIAFADRNHGWAVGDGGFIVATLDGGATWTLQEPGGFWDLRGVAFVDATHGWAVGGGVIVATTDGGVTWKVQSATPAWDLRDVAFTDALHGVAVGLDKDKSRGVILATSNGGVPGPPAPAITSFAPASGAEGTVVTITGTGFSGATAVAFNGTSAAFSVTGDAQIKATVPAAATSGPISVTTPGGTARSATAFSVTAVPLPVPTVTSFLPASGPAGTVVTLTGAGFWKGATVAFNGTPATSVTVDGATQITTAVPAGATSGPISVTTPGGTGTSAASFTVTVPAASGWGTQPSGTTVTLRAVAATDASRGWAVGDGGTVVTSTNGGQAWTTQSTGVRVALRDVAFSSPAAAGAASGSAPRRAGAAVTGWAVGDSGTIIATTNGGTTWKPQVSGTSATLNGVDFLDAAHGWAVGGSGAILATTNGGTTWSTESAPGAATLSDVTFTDAGHGWAVGESGAILATTNGGSTWSSQTSGSTATLAAVSFPDAAHGWAVGAAGTILVTANGGATWRRQSSGTSADLRGVTFVDRTHGWAVGAAGTVLVTTSGGATWAAQRLGATAPLLGLVFPDASHGWAVGALGTILHTATGGWLPVPRITTVTPASGRRGAQVTIIGSDFGATRGLGYVRFGGKKCSTYLVWSALGITCRVPAKVRYGTVKVTVTTPLGRSNAKTFRVKR